MTSSLADAPWEFGACKGGMNGCGWAQRGTDHATWTHFASVAEAEAFASCENGRPTGPCGFCGFPLGSDAEFVRDPFDDKEKWVCGDATACAERGRKP